MSRPTMCRTGVCPRIVVAALMVAVTVAGPGCGVLTVDVDVYKGPLANEPDVQVHQVAVTALAAKPLLARLRYELEKRARYWEWIKNEGVRGTFAVDEADRKLRSSSDWICPSDKATEDLRQFNFLSPQAALVNDILSLYGFPDEGRYISPAVEVGSMKAQKPVSVEDFKRAVLNALGGELATANQGRRNALTGDLAIGSAPGAGTDVDYESFLKGIPAAGALPCTLSPEQYRQRWTVSRAQLAGGPNSLDVLVNLYTTAQAAATKARRGAATPPPGAVDDDRKASIAAEVDLFDKLIQFSQQVLFVANQESLFRDTQGVVENTSDGIHDALAGGVDGYAIDHAYVRVLQAVGNSILVNVDELRERGDFDDAQRGRAPSEADALGASLRPPAAQVLSDLIAAIQRQIAPLAKTLSAPDDVASDKEKAKQNADDAKTKAAAASSGKAASIVAASQSLRDILAGKQALTPGDPNNVAKLTGNDATATGATVWANLGKALNPPPAGWDSAKDGDPTAVLPKVNLSDPNDASTKALTKIKGSSPAFTVAAVLDWLNTPAAQKALGVTDAAAKLADAQAAATAARNWALLVQLRHAQAALAEVMPAVLAPRDPPDANLPSPSVVYDRLRAALTDAKTKASSDQQAAMDADKKASTADTKAKVKSTGATLAKYTDALDDLAGRTPPAEVIALGGEKATKEVMDKLIATYRYQYLEAVRENGEDDPKAKNLKTALADAEEQRSGMIYIRPASSYLRSSTPTSSLQRDARIGWNNMLLEQYSHQVPFAADLYANGNRKDYETVLELDKQYWQNVNTIRVAGGGNTNYVVAKDDVGNWYVKNMTTDPKDIIHSATSLAMFAAGPSLGGADLVNKVEQQFAATDIAGGGDPSTAANGVKAVSDATKCTAGTSAGQGGGVGSAATLTSAQAAQFQAATSRYTAATKAQAATVRDALAGLPRQAADAVPDLPLTPEDAQQKQRKSLRATAQQAVKDDVATALAELQSKSASVDEQSAAIGEGLRAMVQACDTFKSTVTAGPKPDDAGSQTTMSDAFRSPVLSRADVLAQQRDRTLKRYAADLSALPAGGGATPATPATASPATASPATPAPNVNLGGGE